MERPTSPDRIVLLPGLDGTGELFRWLLDVIPGHYSTRVVSYPTDQVLSYAELLQLLDAQLGGEDELVLVAESFSGPLALRYAVARPERVRAVVLCASFVRSPVPRWLRVFCRTAFFSVAPPAAVLRRFMLGADAPDALVRAVRDAIRRVSPRVLAARVTEVIRVDCAASLRACHAPVLYLEATADRLVGSAAVDAVRAARDGVLVRPVEGPHLLLQREPRRAWDEIDQFLKDISPSAG